MSFWGESFSFNGRSCEEFGLMLYDFNNVSQGDSKFAEQSLQEERIPGSYKTLFYDAQHDKPLEFKLVFGVGEYEANEQEPIDRYEMQVIASWLTDHREYGWLSIDQPDMEGIRYRCIITDLQTIEFSGNKWAFQCTAHCDSPYGYMLPKSYFFEVDGTSEVTIRSRSSMNDAYLPLIEIDLTSGSDFSVVNATDGGRAFTLADLPKGCGVITVDGERGLLSCNSGLNLYNCTNFKWPRLVRGDNKLTLTGHGTVKFTCQYPVLVGG